jgi:hypothetical protein
VAVGAPIGKNVEDLLGRCRDHGFVAGHLRLPSGSTSCAFRGR